MDDASGYPRTLTLLNIANVSSHGLGFGYGDNLTEAIASSEADREWFRTAEVALRSLAGRSFASRDDMVDAVKAVLDAASLKADTNHLESLVRRMTLL